MDIRETLAAAMYEHNPEPPYWGPWDGIVEPEGQHGPDDLKQTYREAADKVIADLERAGYRIVRVGGE